MSFLENAAFVTLILLPVIVVANALAASLLVHFVLDFLENKVLTRLLKVTLIPVVFVIYLFVYFGIYFNFDLWVEGIMIEQRTWLELSSEEKALTIFPLAAYVLLRAACYVLDWPEDSNGT